MIYEKVQVATTHTVDPLPGVLIRTNMGDVIIVVDDTAMQIGVHGPSDMTLQAITDIVAEVARQAIGEQEYPFTATDADPMILEDNFIFHTMEA